MGAPLTNKPQRHRTAITRSSLSRPIRTALEDGVIGEVDSVFDYGCGKGGDVHRLRDRGIQAAGWDPNFRPRIKLREADVVNIGYVINVIEDPQERRQSLLAAWNLTRRVLIVSARLSGERSSQGLSPLADGWITGRSTFQKFYAQDELRAYIDSTLEAASVPASPGVFYVFRDEQARQKYLLTKLRSSRAATPRVRISDQLFESNKELLEPLMEFFRDRGRLPFSDEPMSCRDELTKEFGSLKRAFRVVLVATGEVSWLEIADQRRTDVRVHVALSNFGGRPRLSELPTVLQHDVKALFGSYKAACRQADELLFALGDPELVDAAVMASSVGKVTRGSIYVHQSAIQDMPPLLRVFEGASRAFLGTVEEGDIVKLRRFQPQVSYLSYPGFDTDPHPSLERSLSVNLHTFNVRYRYFATERNPPILHRKELFVSSNYALRPKFERLTTQEERHGLFNTSEPIGRRTEWNRRLQRSGFRLQGHRLTHNVVSGD